MAHRCLRERSCSDFAVDPNNCCACTAGGPYGNYGKIPIRCPHCKGIVVDDEKALMHYVIPADGIRCPHCREIAIAPAATWGA